MYAEKDIIMAGEKGSFSDLTGALGDIIGGSSKGSGSSFEKTTGSERLILQEEAIKKIIEDVLGGADGLASIFSTEQVSGIFDSSVAAQAAGDLAAKLVGEIALLTGEKVTSGTATGTSKQEGGSEGLLGGILGGVSSGIKSIGKVFGF